MPTPSVLLSLVQVDGVLHGAADGGLDDLREHVRNGLADLVVDAVLDVLVGVHASEVAHAVGSADTFLGIFERGAVAVARLSAAVVSVILVADGSKTALLEAVISKLSLLLAVYGN